MSSSAAVGNHWNPFNVAHGCGEPRSAGDLGNWLAVGGLINETKILDLVALSGDFSVIGRAIVLHNLTDDCTTVSSSGARLAGGVIGVQNMAFNQAYPAPSFGTGPFFAACKIVPTSGSGIAAGVNGHFTWYQASPTADTYVSGTIGRNASVGVHVHSFGDLTDRATGLATGGHYDPLATGHHDFPNATVAHHAGDMGNTDAASQINGVMWFYEFFSADHITVQNTAQNTSIIGRGFIVHGGLDHGPSAQPTGAAGTRDGQCVIGIASTTLTAVPAFPGYPVAPTTAVSSASLLSSSALLFALALIASLF